MIDDHSSYNEAWREWINAAIRLDGAEGEEREEGGAINGLTISVLTHQLVKKLAQLIFSSHGRVWVTFPQLQPSKARSNSDPRIALFPALTLLRMRTCLHAHYLEKEGNSIRGETTQIQFIDIMHV